MRGTFHFFFNGLWLRYLINGAEWCKSIKTRRRRRKGGGGVGGKAEAEAKEKADFGSVRFDSAQRPGHFTPDARLRRIVVSAPLNNNSSLRFSRTLPLQILQPRQVHCYS